MGRTKKRSKDARAYMKKFRLWDKGVSDGATQCERETLYSQNYGNSVAFTPKNDEVFVQCYTADITAKFYKVRHYLPKYWFISQYGNLISFLGETGIYVKPSNTGKKAEGKQREAYKPQYIKSVNGPVNLDVALLVALSFGYEATTNAQKLLDRYGLKALKRGKKGSHYVEIHHQYYGYSFAKENETLEDKIARRAYNCLRDRLLLIRNDEHDIMKLRDEKKIMKALADTVTDEKVVALIDYEGSHGTMIEIDDDNYMKYLQIINVFCFNYDDAVALNNAKSHNYQPTIAALDMYCNISQNQPEKQSGIIYDIPVESGRNVEAVIQILNYER